MQVALRGFGEGTMEQLDGVSEQRDGIFAGDDPFRLLQDWIDAATKTEPNDPNAMTLATVDSSGMPNARILLVKEVEPDGIVFFTNYDSTKGEELESAGKAAFVLHWKSLGRQVRGRGRVARVADALSDAYFQSRPLDSRLGAWASAQSRPLESRDVLMARVEHMRARYGDTPPRPRHWGGYRLIPTELEFWADGAFRLHDRFRWKRSGSGSTWLVERLSP